MYRWYHRQFWEAAEKRYLQDDNTERPPLPVGDGETRYSQKKARHLALAKYFEGEWSSPNLVACIPFFSFIDENFLFIFFLIL